MKIFAHDYKIPHCDLTDEGNFGECVPEHLEILLEKTLPASIRLEVGAHELIEAFNFHLELRLKHNQITSLGYALAQFLKDNGLSGAFDALLKGKK